jgi:hypothetical protein
MNSSCAVARKAIFDKGLEINNLWNFNWVLTKDIFMGYEKNRSAMKKPFEGVMNIRNWCWWWQMT